MQKIVDEVLVKMGLMLDATQASRLREVLSLTLYQYDIVPKSTALTTQSDSNDYYFMLYAKEMSIERKSDRTVYQVQRATRKFVSTVGKSLVSITGDDAMAYFYWLIKQSNLSDTSVDNERRYIRSFFNWLTDKDYIVKNPLLKIKPIKRQTKQKDILDGTDITSLRDVATSHFDVALLDFIYATGPRVSEIRLAEVSSVNWIDGSVSLYAPKTGTYRTVFLDAPALAHLKSYLDHRKVKSKYLFATKTDSMVATCTIERHLQKLEEKAGLKKRCTVHLFRRSLVSRLYKKGMDITKIAALVGHSSSTTTVKYYLSMELADLKHEYQSCVA